jgi:hypothetical protein
MGRHCGLTPGQTGRLTVGRKETLTSQTYYNWAVRDTASLRRGCNRYPRGCNLFSMAVCQKTMQTALKQQMSRLISLLVNLQECIQLRACVRGPVCRRGTTKGEPEGIRSQLWEKISWGGRGKTAKTRVSSACSRVMSLYSWRDQQVRDKIKGCEMSGRILVWNAALRFVPATCLTLILNLLRSLNSYAYVVWPREPRIGP